MAYLSFDFAAGATIAPAAFTRPAARFTATEWAVIHLARRDGIATTHASTVVGRFVRRLFGIGTANRLADPRLEALRQAAVHCWHGSRTLGDDQINAMLASGFAFDQVALLSRHASGAVQ